MTQRLPSPSTAQRRVPAPERRFVTRREIAAILGVGEQTVADAERRGEIPCKRIGSRVLISAAWLAAFTAEPAA